MRSVIKRVYFTLFDLINNDQTNSTLIMGSSWALLGRVLKSFIALLLNVLIVRLLQPSEVGDYFLGLTLVMGGSALSNLGFKNSSVKIISESLSLNHFSKVKDAILKIVLLSLSGSVVIIAVIVGLLGEWLSIDLFNATGLYEVFTLIGLWVLLFSQQIIVAELLRGFSDIKNATIFGGLLSQSMTFFVLVVMLLLGIEADLYLVLIIIIGCLTFNILVGYFFIFFKMKNLGLDRTKLRLRELSKISFPLWATEILLFVLAQAPFWILAAYLSQDEVGLYGAALKLVTLVVMPLQIINAVLPPIISGLYARGDKLKLERKIRITSTLASIPSFIILSIILLFSEQILIVLYGSFYEAAGPILIILSIGQVVNVWAGSCGITLMMTNNQNSMLIITFISSLISIGLSLLLIKHYGPEGIALATLSGMVMQNIGMLFYSKLKTDMWTHVSFSLLYRKLRTL